MACICGGRGRARQCSSSSSSSGNAATTGVNGGVSLGDTEVSKGEQKVLRLLGLVCEGRFAKGSMLYCRHYVHGVLLFVAASR
jgi:hypothetical protein